MAETTPQSDAAQKNADRRIIIRTVGLKKATS